MATEPSELMNGYLDDTLSVGQHDELAEWIKSSDANALTFAAAVMLHDRLRSEYAAFDPVEHDTARGARRPLRRRPRAIRYAWALTAAASLLLVVIVLAWQVMTGTPAVAAVVELDRIIAAARQQVDRTYVVTAVGVGDGSPASVKSFRRGVQPPIDGAVLHVRGPASYVLVRRYADGTEFITGSDGITSWSVPPAGRVRVSSDPAQFRGALPGQQHAIPFLNLYDDLDRLRAAYDLEVGDSEDTTTDSRQLLAVRKDTARGGPKRVVIWYSPRSSRINRMLLERLPQAHGGPSSVVIELVDQQDRADVFYRHVSHHGPEREVIEE